MKGGRYIVLVLMLGAMSVRMQAHNPIYHTGPGPVMKGEPQPVSPEEQQFTYYMYAAQRALDAREFDDALALQDAGAFAVVLECVPEELCRAVTDKLEIPTIGIGSGKYASGQVQVIADLLGLMEFKPKHAKRFVEGAQLFTQALAAYADEVRSGTFPAEENTFR